MARKKEEFPDQLRANLEKWQSTHPKIDLEQPKVTKALHLLVKNGLDAENLLLVLELLRVYRSPELLENSKREFQNWIKRGKNLATRLRRDAKDFMKLFPGEMLDRGFVKMLLKQAKELESLMNMRISIAQDETFGRQVVGSTKEPTAGAVFLVMASEIIRQTTGKPRYSQLSELLFAFDSDLDPGAVRKRISGFMQRNEAAVVDLRADIASGKHLQWLDEFHAFERRRRQRQQASSPKSPS